MTMQQDNTTRERIEKAILEFSPMVTLDSKNTCDDVRRIISVFMRKHPEIFWFSHQYRYDEKSRVLRFKYNFTIEKVDFFKAEIEKVVRDDFQIDHVRTLSELERLAYVYEWIANRTTYNEYSSFNQTIYSVLVNRNSVCTGYAKTAQYLLALTGIESELVFGKFHSDKSEYGRHGWNIVKISNKWYHVDFCLADKSLSHLLNPDESPKGRDSILWNYFGVSTEKILSNRSIEFIEVLPECCVTLSDYPNVGLLGPARQLICCKSDSGASSKVYLNHFNKDRVVKVSRNNQNELLNNEATTLAKLYNSPHIIKSYGLSESGLELEQLTPWSELLNSHYYNPAETDLKNILRQLIEGLIECRDKGITYSDIHYNNVFVTKDGTYKWGDFGIAFPAHIDGKLPSAMIGDDGKPKGSYWFMAPETYHGKVFTEASAIYSVAMMAYFVMNDMRPPFWTDEEHQHEALEQRLDGKDLPLPISSDRYRDLWSIVHMALSYHKDSRCCSYEDFLSLMDDNIIILEEMPVIESECCPIEMVDCDRPIIVDADNNGCIDDSFAKTSVLESTEVISADDTDWFASTMAGRWGDGGTHDSDSFARTCGIGDWDVKSSINDDFATTAIPDFAPTPNQGVGSFPSPQPFPAPQRVTYGVNVPEALQKRSIWSNLFGKKEKSEVVNASAYAPAEITTCKHFIVRVFIHRLDESDSIDRAVKDIDKTAVKKANKSMDIPIKEGDKITVQLSMTDGIDIDEPIQSMVWRGRYVECDFGCELTQSNLNSVLGKAIVAINNVPCGDLKFTLDVVSIESDKVYAPVKTHRYSKIFISYAHADYSQVRGIAEGCKMNGSDYFFDRHTLQAGDIFKDKILQYIDSADLFVLCWSKNAAESEWVQIERKHALELIERGNHQLAIYPLIIPPEAPLPLDMSDKYNFVSL
ncbi:MAG: TIR domain-containing protein [Clostridium sp.]|nr:TIR domain-containing protein [Clostridium sp.]